MRTLITVIKLFWVLTFDTQEPELFNSKDDDKSCNLVDDNGTKNVSSPTRTSPFLHLNVSSKRGLSRIIISNRYQSSTSKQHQQRIIKYHQASHRVVKVFSSHDETALNLRINNSDCWTFLWESILSSIPIDYSNELSCPSITNDDVSS